MAILVRELIHTSTTDACTELPVGLHGYSNSSITGALSRLRMYAPL